MLIRMRAVLLAGTLLMLSTALCACGAASRLHPAPGAASPSTQAPLPPDATPLSGLPRPSLLLPQPESAAREASDALSEADVQLAAAAFDPLLPNDHAQAFGSDVHFTSSWVDGVSSGLSDVAYCTYHFELPGYDRNAEIRTFWGILPIDFAGYYIGLANWEADRWDWYADGEFHRNVLDSLAPYLTFDGDLLLVVATLEDSPAELAHVRIGGRAPQAQLESSASYGMLPFTFTLDASASVDPEDYPLSFEFDTNGDGSFDTAPSATPTTEVTLTNDGAVAVAVRVTNSNHVSSVAQLTVYAVSTWRRSLGLDWNDNFSDLAVAPNGMIYTVGSLSTPQPDLLLCKWSPCGDLLWARSFDAGEEDKGSALALHASGDVIVGGTQEYIGDRHMLLQKWSSAGELLWSRHWGGPDFSYLADVAVNGDWIYTAGDLDTGGGDYDIGVYRFDLDGYPDWGQFRDTGDDDYICNLVTRSSLLNFYGVAVLCEIQPGGGNFNLWKLEYSSAGVFQGGAQLGSQAQEKRYGKLARHYDILSGDASYFISGQYHHGSDWWLFLAKTDDGGSGLWGKEYSGTDAYPTSIAFDASGQVVLGGYWAPQGGLEGYLLASNPDTGAALMQGGFEASGGAEAFKVWPYKDQLLVAGYAPNSSYTGWSSVPDSPDNLAWSFTDYPGSGGELTASVTASSALVQDVTAQVTLDSGAGGDDALLVMRDTL